jgi:hypothetical protein
VTVALYATPTDPGGRTADIASVCAELLAGILLARTPPAQPSRKREADAKAKKPNSRASERRERDALGDVWLVEQSGKENMMDLHALVNCMEPSNSAAQNNTFGRASSATTQGGEKGGIQSNWVNISNRRV